MLIIRLCWERSNGRLFLIGFLVTKKNMRLELGTFTVEEIRFGASTSWLNGILEIDREELIAEIRKDPRITSVSLEIARPGDSVRITTVRDVWCEPRSMCVP